ncbi:TadG family pilus assembly protein [Rubripirellula reticaptiva]
MVAQRRGSAAVFGLVLTMSLVALMAVTLDFGQIHVGETELRRSADAAAMAACWEMYDEQSAGSSQMVVNDAAFETANHYASANTIGQQAAVFANQDVELGNYDNSGQWSTSDPTLFNAVRVTLRRQSESNGELPLFFGSLTGRESQSMHVTATAAMLQSISGFYEPSDSTSTINILPLALDLPSWLDAIAGETTDEFAYINGTVQSGSDGIFETNLYPKGTGAPGNRGTVDIGGANNSTADLSRQILHGISLDDFIELGKPLEFDDKGELELNGDTGISAGIKDELAALIGKKRVIPIYTAVAGNGNNAMFTIVRFEGVRILDVKLTGKKTEKRVIIQPAKVVARRARIDFAGTSTSTHLVTPVMLVE